MEDLEKQNKEMTAREYFDELKSRKNTMTAEGLDKIYAECEKKLKKYIVTGQVFGARKLMFHLKCIEKEKKIVDLGIDRFIYMEDIRFYIENVIDRRVKLCELECFPREIPDEIVDTIIATKNIFNKFYVLFTDYTETVTTELQKTRQIEHDPILFGSFQDKDTQSVNSRFYFLGDWVDEYCDLTLDKLVSDFARMEKETPVRYIATPTTMEELETQLEQLVEDKSNEYRMLKNEPLVQAVEERRKSKGLFSKVTSVLKKN